MTSTTTVLIAWAGFVLAVASGNAQPRTTAHASLSAPMQFTMHQPCGGSSPRCGAYILAEGEIMENTPRLFERFVRRLDFEPTVYFHSPGGSLGAAVKLGEAIRKAGLNTYVGGPYVEDEGYRIVVAKGVCFSACVYAFAGGRIRTLAPGGTLGVHQFHTPSHDAGESSAQLAVTVLAAYLDQMEVDRKLLDLASLAAPSEIRPISPALARELSLDNSAPPLAGWQLKAGSDGRLALVVSQAREGHTAASTVQIWRSGQWAAIRIAFTIHQHFRSAQEMDDVFLADDHEFNFRLNDDRDVFSGTACWKRLNQEGYQTEFLVPLTLLDQLSHAPGFAIEWDWPRAYHDVDPSVELPTAGLIEGVKAMERQP